MHVIDVSDSGNEMEIFCFIIGLVIRIGSWTELLMKSAFSESNKFWLDEAVL